MKLITTASALALVVAGAAHAQETQCDSISFSDVGWTDITATTALASEVLEGMGYEARVDTVSVPIAYSGMENGDFDVFLGNWMPSMASISDPYVEKGTVDRLTANLEGAKYTLAVPQYVYDAGVTSVEDLAEHADQFDQQPELSVPQGPMLPAVGLQAALDAPHRAVVREGFGIQVVHGELGGKDQILPPVALPEPVFQGLTNKDYKRS